MTKAQYESKVEWYVYQLFWQNRYTAPITQEFMDNWMLTLYIDLGL